MATGTVRIDPTGAPRTPFIGLLRGALFPGGTAKGHILSSLQCEVYVMIDIENLRLTIEGKDILKGVYLHLQPSDIYGLLGPNGAGKSSTIFALLGLRECKGKRK
jgi:ABC-type molybdenum transport system ATPase subunit/photorepair protein PhrA